jgi:glycosyltransferase involved in cell wall biosynthesis
LKVIEYMAAGMPVIATVETEAGDLVSRARCGWSIPFDAGALAEAVSSLLLDPAQFQELASNAVAESRRFDWDAIFAQEVETIGSADRGSDAR